MKKWSTVLTTAVVFLMMGAWGYHHFSIQNELVLDASDQPGLPAEFRMAPDLKMMGSAQFSVTQLNNVLRFVNQPVVIVDLREETHGFIAGNAVSWMTGDSAHWVPAAVSRTVRADRINLGKIMGTVQVYEVTAGPDGKFYNTAYLPLPMVDTTSENWLANGLGIRYFNFPVPYHNIPAPKTVDHFVTDIASVPRDAWIYFHCRDGIMRTSLFMSMYDMLQNARNTDFNTFLQRNYVRTSQAVSEPFDADQLGFLKNFYQYCQQSDGSHKMSWSTWLENYGANASVRNNSMLAQER